MLFCVLICLKSNHIFMFKHSTPLLGGSKLTLCDFNNMQTYASDYVLTCNVLQLCYSMNLGV